MARKSVIKLSQINAFFFDDNKAIEKGENSMESGHVLSMTYTAKEKIIQGSIKPSMKDTPYLVKVRIIFYLLMVLQYKYNFIKSHL